MKKISTIIFLFVVAIFSSCNNSSEAKQEKTNKEEVIKTEKTIENGDFIVSNSASSVVWSAEGLAHGHTGGIKIVAGKFTILNGKVSEGAATIDLNSITCSDIKDENKNKDLLDHLKGEDFFNVAEFPTATIEISEATDGNNVKAKLTIKDKTEEIVFPVELSIEGENIIVSSKFSIDRTKFGVTYNSKNFFKEIGDRMIKDEVSFSIKLTGKKLN